MYKLIIYEEPELLLNNFNSNSTQISTLIQTLICWFTTQITHMHLFRLVK
jgi:hypothetical protein